MSTPNTPCSHTPIAGAFCFACDDSARITKAAVRNTARLARLRAAAYSLEEMQAIGDFADAARTA